MVVVIEKEEDQTFKDLESVFLNFVGNFKKLKRAENKDVYKCQECDFRLEIEKKGSDYHVSFPLSNKEHDPFNEQHLSPFQLKKDNQIPLHTSCESFVKLYLKNKKNKADPEDILK